jgi:stage V sporulation protein S
MMTIHSIRNQKNLFSRLSPQFLYCGSYVGFLLNIVSVEQTNLDVHLWHPGSGQYKEEPGMEILKVSAKSNPNSVAGALAGVLRERGGAEIQAIGAGALNQAVKAVAIARGFVAPSGVDLICIPAFTDILIDGEERTAIKLIVEPR